MDSVQIIERLKNYSNQEKVEVFKRFFKTSPGQYGHGDQFLGITVPKVREVVKEVYQQVELPEIGKLLASPDHEVRLAALIILTYKFPKSDLKMQKEIYKFYLKHRSKINNWDLVDLSADKILGVYLLDHPGKIEIMKRLSQSENLWDRRISVLATFAFIKKNKFDYTIYLAEKLLNDKHDLIQKSIGWLLREIGKRYLPVLLEFLDQHYRIMPRTMLRYAIEKLSSEQKLHYMQKNA